MTPEEQVDEWVKGNPIHNNENRPIYVVNEKDEVVRTLLLEGGECCPDFSCCEPKLLWSEKIRLEFKNADENKREQMLMMSLSGLTALVEPVKVLVVDGSSSTEH